MCHQSENFTYDTGFLRNLSLFYIIMIFLYRVYGMSKEYFRKFYSFFKYFIFTKAELDPNVFIIQCTYLI